LVLHEYLSMIAKLATLFEREVYIYYF
jgi:hypothetical protein